MWDKVHKPVLFEQNLAFEKVHAFIDTPLINGTPPQVRKLEFMPENQRPNSEKGLSKPNKKFSSLPNSLDEDNIFVSPYTCDVHRSLERSSSWPKQVVENNSASSSRNISPHGTRRGSLCLHKRSLSLPESLNGPMLALRHSALKDISNKVSKSSGFTSICNNNTLINRRTSLVDKKIKVNCLVAQDSHVYHLTPPSPKEAWSQIGLHEHSAFQPIHRPRSRTLSPSPRPRFPTTLSPYGFESSAFHPFHRPSSRTLSPSVSPRSSRSTSPFGSSSSCHSVEENRSRSNSFSMRTEALPYRLPRDPTQPSHGSLSDMGSNASFNDLEDDEERDSLPSLSPLPRPRARTCPENRAWQRRAKRSVQHNRPLTPPPPLSSSPGGTSSKHMSFRASKEHILPFVPESAC